MSRKISALLAIACAAGLSACGAGQSNSPSPTKNLGSFHFAQSCDEVKSYVRGYAERFQKYPNRVMPVAEPAAAPSAPTAGNAPEAAADSGGQGGAVVQSDLAFPDTARGLLYTLDQNEKILKIFRVDPASQASLTSTLNLDFYPTEVVAAKAGNRFFAVVFGGTNGGYYGIAPVAAQTLALSNAKSETVDSPPETVPGDPGFGQFPVNNEEPRSVIAVVETTSPNQPKLLREEEASGFFLEARALSGSGKILWVSERYVPIYLDQLNDAQILPQKKVRIAGVETQAAVADCSQIYLYDNPTVDPAYSPYALNGAVVSVLDLNAPEGDVQTQAIYSPAWRTLIAANSDHLFLAQNVDGSEGGDTEFYQFELGSSNPLGLSASTYIPGNIPNQFFIDEKDGVVRVFHHVQNFGPICIDNCSSGGGGSVASPPMAAMKAQETSAVGNYLSTYRATGGQFELLGRNGPFESEEVPYAARFIAKLGCVVTYRQIDPLTCFALQDPSQPMKLGELKIEGVSFHLEALTDTLLLGIGQNGDNAVVANLFDISNPALPSLAAQRVLSGGGSYAYSPVFYDYRALAKDESLRNFGVPIEEEGGSTLALISVNPATKQISSLGDLHKSFGQDGPYDSFQRAFFFSESLATVSYQQMEVFLRSNLSSVFSAPLTN